MRRIDALADHGDERLSALTGEVLGASLDVELQAIVAQAARELDLPIALVSLILERTQFFRAHIGLPADLAVARATDRDASFCQFVVRDGSPFEDTDAIVDQRVPQELVERYGIRAYLGVPVRIGAQYRHPRAGVLPDASHATRDGRQSAARSAGCSREHDEAHVDLSGRFAGALGATKRVGRVLAQHRVGAMLRDEPGVSIVAAKHHLRLQFARLHEATQTPGE